MAQQFIKIFNDTVLKQSVNQGFEEQRTNPTLGKFTMGELAFTRDTARLFVGNISNPDDMTEQTTPSDSNAVVGGALVGNKYLGLIDSKPIVSKNRSQEENKKPLSYTSNTSYSSDSVVEPALLSSDSKFRTDKNNGWNKETTYNEDYDAYNGDFIYDAYNNALILFDKTIDPDNKVLVDTENGIQKFYKFSDTGAKEYFDEKENFSTRRTPFQNSKAKGLENHPIYGNGYVMMRILEPDGETLAYVEKEYINDLSEKNDNYSHNYITLNKVPIEKIKEHFDDNIFTTNSDTSKLTLDISNLIDGDNVSNNLSNHFIKKESDANYGPNSFVDLPNIIRISSTDSKVPDGVFNINLDTVPTDEYSEKLLHISFDKLSKTIKATQLTILLLILQIIQQ